MQQLAESSTIKKKKKKNKRALASQGNVRKGKVDAELGLWSKLAVQALLHPTIFPEGSEGPLSGLGPVAFLLEPTEDNRWQDIHFGFKSTRQSATGQPLLLSIRIGRLKPSTRDTRKYA